MVIMFYYIYFVPGSGKWNEYELELNFRYFGGAIATEKMILVMLDL